MQSIAVPTRHLLISPVRTGPAPDSTQIWVPPQQVRHASAAPQAEVVVQGNIGNWHRAMATRATLGLARVISVLVAFDIASAAP